MAVMTQARCQECRAVINQRWTECLACRASITSRVPKTSSWVNPQDQRFKDGFRTFQKWLDVLQPRLSAWHPKHRKAMQREFDRMDACWLNGDLAGFRQAIHEIRQLNG